MPTRSLTSIFVLCVAAALGAQSTSLSFTLDGKPVTSSAGPRPELIGYSVQYGANAPDRNKRIQGAPAPAELVQVTFGGSYNGPDGQTTLLITVSGYTPEQLTKVPLTIPISTKTLMSSEKHLAAMLGSPKGSIKADSGHVVLEEVNLATRRLKGRFELTGRQTYYAGPAGGVVKLTEGVFDLR